MYIEKVVKRNGDIVPFDKQKIVIAIMKAMTDSDEINKGTALRIANDISKTENQLPTIQMAGSCKPKLTSLSASSTTLRENV